MNEKRYFRYEKYEINTVYAFPSGIRVSDCVLKEISISNFDVKLVESDEDYIEITESEFLEVYHKVMSDITILYHNQFSKENMFIRNEQLKSEGY